MDKSEMRRDPLTEAWTVFTPGRPILPTYASVRSERTLSPSPFMAGSERFAPHALHEAREADAWQVRVVPNRTPVVRVEGDAAPHPDGFYDRADAVGAHEVVIETPDGKAFEDLPLAGIERVISAWKFRMLDLMRDQRLRAFTIVKSVGAPAGSQVSHAISQLLALAIIPPHLGKKLEVARAFFRQKKRSIFEDILAEEIRTGQRLVYENNGFAAFCPYASRVPFELAIYPKRQCPDFHGLSDQELAQLADVLRTVLRKLALALGHPAYNLMLHTAPARTERRDAWFTIESDFRWHLEIMPRLQPLGGVELATGCWVNPVYPEIAADYLRTLEDAPEPTAPTV